MDKNGYIQIRASGILENQVNEPSSYVHWWDGYIYLQPEVGNGHRIGTFKVIYINITGAMNQGLPPFDVFDTHQATCDYLALYDENYNYSQKVINLASIDEFQFNPNLLILDRLVIYPKYRGNNLGLQALSTLILRFKAGAGLIAIKPFPLQMESHFQAIENAAARLRLKLDDFPTNQRTATNKLRTYYAKLGFKHVPKTDYMVLNPEKPVNDICA